MLVGWSGGAKVLGKLPVPGRPTYLDYSRARAYCPCNRCGWGSFRHFFSHLSLLFSFSLSLGDGTIQTEILQSNLDDSTADFSKPPDCSNLTVSPDLFCYYLM